MSIVTVANEAEALKKIWDALTGCSIAWEVENQNLSTCTMAYARQGSGTRHGTWDDIPTGKVEECGTQHDGVFGSGNNGGVMYELLPGTYFAIMWSDPSVGSSYYYTYWGTESEVLPVVQKWSNTYFSGGGSVEISGGATENLNIGGATVKVQPGFDPFGLIFISNSKDEVSRKSSPLPTPPEPLDCSSNSDSSNISSREEAADRYETVGRSLLESSKRLRGS